MMNVDGKHYRTIWLKQGDESVVQIIDQRYLPHRLVIEDLKSLDDFIIAIKDMHVRGAGLIGATAGFGMYVAVLNNQDLFETANKLMATRPTAVNLERAINLQLTALDKCKDKVQTSLRIAKKIADEEVGFCKKIGFHGLKIIERISKEKNGGAVNILTHCNAGWLAFVDYGTATAPIYAAFDKGIKVHVWVDETRPRNQGSNLTAWELLQQGVPHTIISDNLGGYLMQKGMVDICIVGADRVTSTGDVANKVGTYLKALAAKDNNIPFYAAFPSSTFDWGIKNGLKQIPIEQRSGEEVKYATGLLNGEIKSVLLTPKKSNAVNFAFDITPRKLFTGLITERGVCFSDEKSILNLYPKKR